MRTYHPKESETTNKKWYLVDLKGKVLGRAATQIADLLRGKNSPRFTPSVDMGGFVVAINAGDIKLTGKKATDKIYYRHTGYFGGVKSTTAGKLLQKDARQIITKAVEGMLPSGPLGYKQIKKLKVYVGADHPHAAQKPQTIG